MVGHLVTLDQCYGRRKYVLVWSAKCCRAYDRMRCVGSLTEECLHSGSQFQPPNTAIHIIGRRKQFVLVLFRWSAKMYLGVTYVTGNVTLHVV